MHERRTKRKFDVGSSSVAPPPPPVRDQYPWPREREDEPIPLFDNFADTRKAAKSAACKNCAIEDAWDDYDIIFYNEWLRVSIEPTRFVDPDVIRALGIKSGLEDMLTGHRELGHKPTGSLSGAGPPVHGHPERLLCEREGKED